MGGIRCAIIMFTGISSPEKLCRLAFDMLDRDPAFFGGGPGLCNYLLKQSLIPAEPQPASDIEEIGELLANGMSLLLIDDCDQAVVFSTQEMPQRSISTPSGEGNMRGPQGHGRAVKQLQHRVDGHIKAKGDTGQPQQRVAAALLRFRPEGGRSIVRV